MTAAQLRRALERSGRTVRGAAQEMEIHERTMHKYLAGALEIPKLVELVTKCWLQHSDEHLK